MFRTCLGLGYYVGCNLVPFFGIDGFCVFVSADANEFNCTQVENHIKIFIENKCQMFIEKELTEKQFDEFRSSLIMKKKASDLSITKEASKYWAEITKLDYCLDINAREAEELRKVNYFFNRKCFLMFTSIHFFY